MSIDYDERDDWLLPTQDLVQIMDASLALERDAIDNYDYDDNDVMTSSLECFMAVLGKSEFMRIVDQLRDDHGIYYRATRGAQVERLGRSVWRDWGTISHVDATQR